VIAESEKSTSFKKMKLSHEREKVQREIPPTQGKGSLQNFSAEKGGRRGPTKERPTLKRKKRSCRGKNILSYPESRAPRGGSFRGRKKTQVSKERLRPPEKGAGLKWGKKKKSHQ